MNMRLKKVLDDIQKTENKILELQEHVRQLRIQKKQMEDAEIIKAIRSMKMDSRKMLTFLDGIQNGTVTMQFDEEGNLSMDSEYSCAMKSHFRKFGNQMSGSGNHLCNYASLLA